MDLQEAIQQRYSARAFLPRPVPPELLRELLEQAAQSPSGTNVQPWNLYVVTGSKRDELVQAVQQARASGQPEARENAADRRDKEPYRGRSRELGKELYSLIGIPKGDRMRMWRQWGRNFKFFDAPAGIIFTIDKELGQGKWLDVGMYMQTFMLLARSRGLDTCAQGAWCGYYQITKDLLQIPAHEVICAGMSVGYADPTAPENRIRSSRVRLDEFARIW